MSASPVMAVSGHSDALILAAWQRHQQLRLAWRQTRSELAKLRLDLGQLLAHKRAALAHAGPGGQFDAWLRQNAIPRTTGYRLIERWENRLNPAKSQRLNVPRGTINSPGPCLELRGQALTIRLNLTAKQATVAHAILEAFNRQGIQLTELREPIVNCLAALSTGSARPLIDGLQRGHEGSFPRALAAAQPPIRLVIQRDRAPAAASA